MSDTTYDDGSTFLSEDDMLKQILYDFENPEKEDEHAEVVEELYKGDEDYKTDNSKPSVLAEMLNRNSPSSSQQSTSSVVAAAEQEPQQQQQHQYVYPMNNYYYHQEAPTSSHMMNGSTGMTPQYFQPQYVYYPNHHQMQSHQGGVFYYQQVNNTQRYPYQQQVFVQPRMPPPQGQHRPMQQQPSYVQVYQQQYPPPQASLKIPQIPPKSMLQDFQIMGPEKHQTVATFEMPPTPTKLSISGVAKDASRSMRASEPYKTALILHAKPKDRQATGEATLLEINAQKYQRWYKCVEYLKTYLSSTNELIPFIVYVLENSATSNDLIQWKERTTKFEHDRGFEFKNKEGITKAYFEVTGKETKYNSIVTRLTRLCNTRVDGCPIFQKTKQRNTYELFPTLIPSHDDTACPIQIVNGLPVETNYI